MGECEPGFLRGFMLACVGTCVCAGDVGGFVRGCVWVWVGACVGVRVCVGGGLCMEHHKR